MNFCAFAFLLLATSAQPQPPVLSPAALARALATNPGVDEAARLVDSVRQWFGKDLQGGAAKNEGLDVAWAIEAPGAKSVRALSLASSVTFPSVSFPLRRLGATDVFAVSASLSDGTVMRWAFEIDGKRAGGGEIEVYAILPDSRPQPGVPKGKVLPQKLWKSRIFEGTEREWALYIPAQFKASSPAALMVFQDGKGAIPWVTPVFDNLIAKGDMPITVGLFVSPGQFAGEERNNRSFEYDTLSDQYVRFLIEEILPEVEKIVKLRKDPIYRAIAGGSSGGICAFTAAWERPDQFGKVMSWSGSFTNIAAGKNGREGGHNYPALIRKTPRKPIRVFLQDGENDLDNAHGNWPLANHAMARALAFAGYDYKIVWGQGFHGSKHMRAILPEALRWLWRVQ